LCFCFAVVLLDYCCIACKLRTNPLADRLDVVKVIVTLTPNGNVRLARGIRQMSKAQRKRNRKVRNLQMNWGRIDRERAEQTAKLKKYNRSINRGQYV
jgi:hypothetical protein